MAINDKYFYIGDKMVMIGSQPITVGSKVVCMSHNQGLLKSGEIVVSDEVLIMNTSSGKVALKTTYVCSGFWHSLKMYVHDTGQTVYATDESYTQRTTISDTLIEVGFEDAADFDFNDGIIRVEWLSETEAKITLLSRSTNYTHSYYYNDALLWGSVTAQGTLNWTKTEPLHCGA